MAGQSDKHVVKEIADSSPHTEAASNMVQEAYTSMESDGKIVVRKGQYVEINHTLPHCEIVAEPGSHLKARCASGSIDAQSGSVVIASNMNADTIVTAENGSQVFDYGSHVVAKNGSHVTEYWNINLGQHIEAEPGSFVIASVDSHVHAQRGSHIDAQPGSHISADSGADVHYEEPLWSRMLRVFPGWDDDRSYDERAKADWDQLNRKDDEMFSPRPGISIISIEPKREPIENDLTGY
jgi:hypothetical protein